MLHALRYSQARRRSVSAMPGIASRIKVANGPSHSQPVTSSRVWGVNSSGAALARLRRGPRCGGPVPRRLASGYAVPQRRYPLPGPGARVDLDHRPGNARRRLSRVALLRDGGGAQVLEQVGLPGQDPGEDLPCHR